MSRMNRQSNKGTLLSCGSREYGARCRLQGTGSWGFKTHSGMQGHMGHSPILQGYSNPWTYPLRNTASLCSSIPLYNYTKICQFSDSQIYGLLFLVFMNTGIVAIKSFTQGLVHKNKHSSGYMSRSRIAGSLHL